MHAIIAVIISVRGQTEQLYRKNASSMKTAIWYPIQPSDVKKDEVGIFYQFKFKLDSCAIGKA